MNDNCQIMKNIANNTRRKINMGGMKINGCQMKIDKIKIKDEY